MGKILRKLDDWLDATILFSFTNLGYGLRRPFWRPLQLDAYRDRHVLITGGSTGIGFHTACVLAGAGARVTILSSNPERSMRAVADIRRKSGNDHVAGIVADLGDPVQVDAAIREFTTSVDRLDILILNAGILPDQRTQSPWGVEQTVAVNLLGPHRLLKGLVDLLERSPDPRVILVSSGGMYGVGMDVERMMDPPEPFDGVRAYAYTKRAQVVLARLYGQRISGRVRFAAMHPGWVRTPGLKTSLPRFYWWMYLLLRTLHQGSDTLVWLGAVDAETLGTGGFWFDRRMRKTVRLRQTPEQEEKLWKTVSVS